jgi:hypothetical protein
MAEQILTACWVEWGTLPGSVSHFSAQSSRLHAQHQVGIRKGLSTERELRCTTQQPIPHWTVTPGGFRVAALGTVFQPRALVA